MRVLPLLIVTALAAGCSCQRTPSVEAVPEQSIATTAAVKQSAAAANEGDASASPSKAVGTVNAEVGRGAANTVHTYLQALLAGGDASNRFWTGGRPAPRPDDAGLRSALSDTTSMRIFTHQAVALDRETPARAVEVPVDLRLSDASATRTYKGWYRLRRKLDGEGWELTSASLQPTLK